MPYAEVFRVDEFFGYLGNMVDFSRPDMLVFKEFAKSVALFEGISYNVIALRLNPNSYTGGLETSVVVEAVVLSVLVVRSQAVKSDRELSSRKVKYFFHSNCFSKKDCK